MLLDFPKQGTARNSGGGGAGGDASGGAGPSACFGAGKGPTATDIYWKGIPKEAGVGEVVEASGLSYVGAQQLLVIYGNASNGLQDYDLPVGQTNQLYMLGVHDNKNSVFMFAGNACTGAWQNHFPTTRRVSANEDFLIHAVGSVPTDVPGTATWSFSLDATDKCGTSDAVQAATATGVPAGDIPFEIEPSTIQGSAGKFLQLDDGALIDVATAKSGASARLGGARGIIGKISVESSTTFVTVSDQPDFNRNTAPLADLPIDTDLPIRSWPGAVDFDSTDTAWFGGTSCTAPGGCPNPALYLGHFAFADTAPTLIESHAGDHSAVTSIRYHSDTLTVGGQYQGNLTIRGVTLPSAPGTVPFVLSLDPVTEQPRWTWPAAADTSTGDPNRFRGVVDVAVSGTASCGAVYVLGCSSAVPIGYQDCLTIEPGKTSFLTKLDLMSGQEIWTNTVRLSDERDLFMPTAIVSADERIWVAATYHGTMTAWDMGLQSGDSRESVVLAIAP